MALVPAPSERDHYQGDLNAPIVIVEYGDFECPFTEAAIRGVRSAQREFGDQLLFVFRLYPLYDIHPHALRAAEAGEAAAAQGLFWPMFEALFKQRGRLSETAIRHAARDAGLDMDQFDADMAGHTQLPLIRDAIVSAEQSGVGGTPTFFINGEYFHHKLGLWDPVALKKAIRSVIEG